MKINYLLVLCFFITTFIGLNKSQTYVSISLYNSITDQTCDDSYDYPDSSSSTSSTSPCQEVQTGGTIAVINKCVPFLGNGTIFSTFQNNYQEIYQQTYSSLECAGNPTMTTLIKNSYQCYTSCKTNSEVISYTASLIQSINIPSSVVTAFYPGECDTANWKENFSVIDYAITNVCSFNQELKYYSISCNSTSETVSAYQDSQCQDEYYAGGHNIQSSCTSLGNGSNYLQFCNE